MIVQAPDNKSIDFGDMPADQVQSAMQKLYPPSQEQQMVTQNKYEMGQGMTGAAKQVGAYGLNALQAIPFSDEAISGIGAAFGGGNGQSIGDRYNDLQQRQQAFREAGIQTQPRIQTPSFMPDITPTGIGQTGATLATMGMLPGFGNATSLTGKVMQGAATGAGYGGLYGAGDANAFSNDTIGEREKNAIKGAATGAVLGGAIPAAGAAIGTVGDMARGFGATAGNAEKLAEKSNELHDAASPFYAQMRKNGDTLTDNASLALKSYVNGALNSSENKYIPALNPKTTAIVDALNDAVDKGSIGVSDIDQYRRLLNRVGGSEDGFSAGVAKKAIDNTLNSLQGKDLSNGTTESIDLLNQARSASAKAFRYQSVADILQKANGDPNRIKSLLGRFVADDDNLRPFNLAEKAALRNAADTGFVGNIVKGFGKLGLDFSKTGTGNTVLPYITSFAKAGGANLVPGGIPMVAAATVARQGQKFAVRGAAQKALDLIENR